MRILVIRHGESEADIIKVHEGRADFELTERGHRQAEAMSEYVASNYNIDRIYCSTLKRAKQTAEHLANKSKAVLISDEKLMEFNNGLLAGLKHSVVEEKYPKVKVPMHQSVYGQESVLEFRYRAEYMLSKIVSEAIADDTVAIVTHGGMINQLYRAFLKLPIETDFFFRTGDTGIHEWVIKGNGRYIVKANFPPHNI